MNLLVFNLATDEDDPILGFTVGWLRGLATRCERVDVITMRGGRASLPGNVRVHSLGKELGRNEVSRGITFYRDLATILRRSRPDAAFAHMTPRFASMAAPLLRRRKIPLTLWYAHGHGGGAVLRRASRAADTIVTPSRESFPLPGTVVVTGHGIDTDLFVPARSSVSRAFRVVMVGRLSPSKRLEVLIRAASMAEIPGLECSIIGPDLEIRGRYVAAMKELVAQDGTNVKFEDAMPRTAIPSVYARSCVAVNLSDTDSVDKAGLEAMACEVPLVTSNRSLAAIVAEADDRLAIPKGDPEALAEALLRLSRESDESRGALGGKLREIVVRDHSLDRLLDLLVDDIFLHSGRL